MQVYCHTNYYDNVNSPAGYGEGSCDLIYEAGKVYDVLILIPESVVVVYNDELDYKTFLTKVTPPVDRPLLSDYFFTVERTNRLLKLKQLMI